MKSPICILCSKSLQKLKFNNCFYSLCSNERCESIILEDLKEDHETANYVLNIPLMAEISNELKITISLIAYTPHLFSNSCGSNAMVLHDTYKSAIKETQSFIQMRKLIFTFRTAMMGSTPHKDFPFLNFFNHIIEKLGVRSDFLVEYTQKVQCATCNVSFVRSLSGHCVTVPFYGQSAPLVAAHMLTYGINCNRCMELIRVTIEIKKLSQFTAVAFKNGFNGFIVTEASSLSPVVILELYNNENKDFKLWIKLQNSGNRWLCQTNSTKQLIKLVDNPTVNSPAVRFIIYESCVDSVKVASPFIDSDSCYGSLSDNWSGPKMEPLGTMARKRTIADIIREREESAAMHTIDDLLNKKFKLLKSSSVFKNCK